MLKRFINILFLLIGTISVSFYEANAQTLIIADKYAFCVNYQNNELNPFPRLKGYDLSGEGYIYKNFGIFGSIGNSEGVWDTTTLYSYNSIRYTLIDYKFGLCIKAGNVFSAGIGYRHLSFRSNDNTLTYYGNINVSNHDTTNLDGFTIWQKVYPFKYVGFFCDGSYLSSKEEPIIGKTIAGEITFGPAIKYNDIIFGAGYIFKGFGNDWIGYHHNGISLSLDCVIYKKFGLTSRYKTFSMHDTYHEDESTERSYDFSIALIYKN